MIFPISDDYRFNVNIEGDQIFINLEQMISIKKEWNQVFYVSNVRYISFDGAKISANRIQDYIDVLIRIQKLLPLK